MVDTDLIRVVFGIIGNVISIGLFASAVPIFYRAVKKHDFVEDVKPHYYLATTISCLFLVLYGLPFISPGNILLLTAYGTGLTINLAYLTILLLYASRQRMYVGGVFLTGLLVFGLVAGLVIGLGHTFEARSTSVGVFCFAIGICMLMPRARLLNEVMDTKSVECMPFLIALSDTLNGLCWCIYFALVSDSFLMAPNGIGFAVGLFQLILYGVYRSPPESCDDEKLSATADKELAQAEHDKEHKKPVLKLEHDKIKQALKLAQAQLAQIELDIAELDELDIV